MGNCLNEANGPNGQMNVMDKWLQCPNDPNGQIVQFPNAPNDQKVANQPHMEKLTKIQNGQIVK